MKIGDEQENLYQTMAQTLKELKLSLDLASFGSLVFWGFP